MTQHLTKSEEKRKYYFYTHEKHIYISICKNRNKRYIEKREYKPRETKQNTNLKKTKTNSKQNNKNKQANVSKYI